MKLVIGKSPRGFTLVEMLISLVLLALIMTAAALAIQAANASYSYNSDKNALVARARGVLDRIASDVRRAASFQVNDAHTVAVTMTDAWIRTYSWDGTTGGDLTYTETDPATITVENPEGIPSDPATLTGHVSAFNVEAAGQGCRVEIRLVGDRATCAATMTATPGKALY